MKRSICLLNDSFPPIIDGVSNAVYNYARIIEKSHGHAVVVTPSVPGVKDPAYAFPVVRYMSVDTRRMLGYVTGYPFSPEVAQAIKNEKIEILHSHCPMSSTLLAAELAETYNLPLILTWHTKFDIDIARALKYKVMQGGVLQAVQRVVSACDEVWTVSRGAGENLRSIGYEGDYVVMPNGVDLPHMTANESEILEIVREYDIPHDLPCFLFVGRMQWYKGIRIILDALKMLAAEGVDFRMVFIGSGGDEAEIKEYSSSLCLDRQIIFIGPVYDRDKLRAWYTRSDLFLFPSTYDTNGLVVREAAASDTAAVMIEGSCAAEGVEDGGSGFLIEENAASLAAKLKKLSENPALMTEVGIRAGRELYISWEDAVSNACERYELVLDKYKSGQYPNRGLLSSSLLRSQGDLMNMIGSLGAVGKEIKSDISTMTRDAMDRIENIKDRLDRYL